jgi:hypothetical protein
VLLRRAEELNKTKVRACTPAWQSSVQSSGFSNQAAEKWAKSRTKRHRKAFILQQPDANSGVLAGNYFRSGSCPWLWRRREM